MTVDKTGPAVATLTTQDTNGDGYVDRLVVSLSENVNAATIVPGSYSVSAGSISGVVDNGVPGDAVIWVNLVDGVLPTDAAPTLSIAAGGIQDLAGNANAAVSNFVSADGAPPVIMSATSTVGSTTLTVTFSEPVGTAAGPAGSLVAADFVYGNVFGGGATGIASMGADADGLDRVVTVTVNSPFVLGDFAADTIHAAAGLIYDGAGNTALPAGVVAIANSDTTPPTIFSRETEDLNGDGFIDAIRVSFSKPISDSTVTPANFTFSGGVTATGFNTAGTADDAVISITFTDGVLKTDAAPTATYTAGTLKDLNGNALASTGAVASVDKAPPVIFMRETSDLNGDGFIDAVRLTLQRADSGLHGDPGQLHILRRGDGHGVQHRGHCQ